MVNLLARQVRSMYEVTYKSMTANHSQNHIARSKQTNADQRHRLRHIPSISGRGSLHPASRLLPHTRKHSPFHWLFGYDSNNPDVRVVVPVLKVKHDQPANTAKLRRAIQIASATAARSLPAKLSCCPRDLRLTATLRPSYCPILSVPTQSLYRLSHD